MVWVVLSVFPTFQALPVIGMCSIQPLLNFFGVS